MPRDDQAKHQQRGSCDPDRTPTDIGHAIHTRIPLPAGAPEAPDLMLYHAALLLGDDDARYVELVWDDQGEHGVFGTLVMITAHRVIRLAGPRLIFAAPGRLEAAEATAQAETWPLSQLRALRLDGTMQVWRDLNDNSPLPAGCAWLLDFDSHSEPFRLPVSPNADRTVRQQAAALARELLGQLR